MGDGTEDRPWLSIANCLEYFGPILWSSDSYHEYAMMCALKGYVGFISRYGVMNGMQCYDEFIFLASNMGWISEEKLKTFKRQYSESHKSKRKKACTQ